MSNPLSVRRVMVQTIKADGTPDGPPMFGVVASDNFHTEFTDQYPSLEVLNGVVDNCGCILDVVDTEQFVGYDAMKIGTDNFYGTDWRIVDDGLDDEEYEQLDERE